MNTALQKRPAVIVTGAAGNLGRLVVQALHRNHSVVAVDRRPVAGLPKDVWQMQTDVRRRSFEDIFRKNKVQAILHLGLAHNPRADRSHYRFNVLGTERILELAAKYAVDAMVMLSSANIYGPDPDNSHFLTEDAPLLGAEHHPQ
ncbi:MAG: NAD-dependent epimerase/dehydratase family protein, partial [Myxococcota bacterium]